MENLKENKNAVMSTFTLNCLFLYFIAGSMNPKYHLFCLIIFLHLSPAMHPKQ